MTNIIQLPTKNEWRNKELLHQKYVVARRSLNELAVEFGVARQTISKQMKKFGIKTRVSGTVQNRKRGLAYGKKVKDREIVIHQREQEVIEKIKELRDQGFSYHKIADVLNVMGIKTKSRKVKWSGKTVWQVLCSIKKA
jgi:phosphopentomutase